MRKAYKLLKPLLFVLVLAFAAIPLFRISSFAIVNYKCTRCLEGRGYYGSLMLTAKVQKKTFTPGENIIVDVTLTNTEQQVFTVVFPDRQKFDLAAWDMLGNEVYRWSKGKMFAQVITPVILQPNQSISQQFNFTIAKKGFYRIKGESAKMSQPSTTIITSPIKILIR